MSIADRAVWCITCGGPPEVAFSIERNGVIGHYGACLAHVHEVADRMLADLNAGGSPGGYAGAHVGHVIEAIARDDD